MTTTEPCQRDFERLLEFRVALRGFQRWSDDQAQAAGLTHSRHQLLVAVSGHRGGKPPAIGDLVTYLDRLRDLPGPGPASSRSDGDHARLGG